MLDMLAMASWPLWMFVDLLSHIVKMVLDQGNPRHGLLFENRQCVRHRVTHMSALPFYIYIYIPFPAFKTQSKRLHAHMLFGIGLRGYVLGS